MVKIMRPADATPPKKVKQSPQTTINKGPAQVSPPKPDFDKVSQIFGSLLAATKKKRLLEKEVAELEGQIASKREQLKLVRDEVIAMSQAIFPDLYDMNTSQARGPDLPRSIPVRQHIASSRTRSHKKVLT